MSRFWWTLQKHVLIAPCGIFKSAEGHNECGKPKISSFLDWLVSITNWFMTIYENIGLPISITNKFVTIYENIESPITKTNFNVRFYINKEALMN